MGNKKLRSLKTGNINLSFNGASHKQHIKIGQANASLNAHVNRTQKGLIKCAKSCNKWLVSSENNKIRQKFNSG